MPDPDIIANRGNLGPRGRSVIREFIVVIRLGIAELVAQIKQPIAQIKRRRGRHPGHRVVLAADLNLLAKRTIAPDPGSKAISRHLVRKRAQLDRVLVLGPFQAARNLQNSVSGQPDRVAAPVQDFDSGFAQAAEGNILSAHEITFSDCPKCQARSEPDHSRL